MEWFNIFFFFETMSNPIDWFGWLVKLNMMSINSSRFFETCSCQSTGFFPSIHIVFTSFYNSQCISTSASAYSSCVCLTNWMNACVYNILYWNMCVCHPVELGVSFSSAIRKNRKKLNLTLDLNNGWIDWIDRTVQTSMSYLYQVFSAQNGK